MDNNTLDKQQVVHLELRIFIGSQQHPMDPTKEETKAIARFPLKEQYL